MNTERTFNTGKKLNSRWRGSRYAHSRKLEDSRWVRTRRGHWRFERDNVNELQWCSRRREQDGWRNGARVTVRAFSR